MASNTGWQESAAMAQCEAIEAGINNMQMNKAFRNIAILLPGQIPRFSISGHLSYGSTL
jgi:hypothetical protein